MTLCSFIQRSIPRVAPLQWRASRSATASSWSWIRTGITMACEPRSSEPLTPHEKRRLGTEQRLRAALERLVGGRPNHRSLRGQTYRLSVSTLAREARVSPNTIYANHRSILEELTTDHQGAQRIRPAPAQKIAELGAMIEQLQQQ